MTYKEAFKRAVATFIAGATAAPLTATAFNLTFLEAAGVAGCIAVWNYLARLTQAWVNDHEGI
jgi:hypothetical protein